VKQLIILPLIGISSIFLAENKKDIKYISLAISLLLFIESTRLYVILDKSYSSCQQVLAIFWGEGTIILFGLDSISIVFILLTTLLIPFCILMGYNIEKVLEKEFYISLLLIELILIFVFTVLDLLGFYIFYEAVLIPVFYLIGVWGSRKQKITASMYFFFYTLIGSVLMLISIIYIYSLLGTTNYLLLGSISLGWDLEKILFLGFMSSLVVKIPMYPFHVWLPLAHVEAPISGSVLLAGILIKLGAYGMIRFVLTLMPNASEFYSPIIYVLSFLGILYASLTTLRQTDLKRIVAYSSVAHMGVVTLGVFTPTSFGQEGAILIQLAHGLVSSGLFICVAILYDRYYTRVIRYYSGIAITMPLFSLWFFILTMSNIAVPGTSNFVGEILTLRGIIEISKGIAVLSCIGMILGGAYGIYMFNRVVFGSFSTYILNAPRDVDRLESFVLSFLALSSLTLGIWPSEIIQTIHIVFVNYFI